MTQRRSSKIQPTTKSMDELRCSQAAERAGSLKILLCPYLLNPCGRLNAACCEISTRMARLFDLALRNCHLVSICFKMAGQVANNGPMRTARRTSRLCAKPSDHRAKMGTFEVGRFESSLTLALISCTLDVMSEFAKKHLQTKPRATLMSSFIIQRQLVTQAETPY